MALRAESSRSVTNLTSSCIRLQRNRSGHLEMRSVPDVAVSHPHGKFGTQIVKTCQHRGHSVAFGTKRETPRSFGFPPLVPVPTPSISSTDLGHSGKADNVGCFDATPGSFVLRGQNKVRDPVLVVGTEVSTLPMPALGMDKSRVRVKCAKEEGPGERV
jgi:hypothetical protein